MILFIFKNPVVLSPTSSSEQLEELCVVCMTINEAYLVGKCVDIFLLLNIIVTRGPPRTSLVVS